MQSEMARVAPEFTVDVFRAIRIGFELSLEFSHVHVGSVTVCI